MLNGSQHAVKIITTITIILIICKKGNKYITVSNCCGSQVKFAPWILAQELILESRINTMHRVTKTAMMCATL
jgi:hypothetical protein